MTQVSGRLIELHTFLSAGYFAALFQGILLQDRFEKNPLVPMKIHERDNYSPASSGSASKKHPVRLPGWRKCSVS